MPDDAAPEMGEDKSLLLVDDDEPFLKRLARAMEKRGFVVETAESVVAGKALATARPPAYAVIDLRLEDGNGLDVVETIRERRPDSRVVVLTGYGAIATAVAAVKIGATDYLSKPADANDITNALLANPRRTSSSSGKPDVGGSGALGAHSAGLRALRPERERDGAAAQHAPPDAAADPRKTVAALMRALPLLIALAACAQPGPRQTNLPPPPGPLVLAENGFGVGGTSMEIGFGRSQDGAIAAASRLIGNDPAGTESVSPCTFATWRGGPTMVFRSRAFVGWIADGVRQGDTCGR